MTLSATLETELTDGTPVIVYYTVEKQQGDRDEPAHYDIEIDHIVDHHGATAGPEGMHDDEYTRIYEMCLEKGK